MTSENKAVNNSKGNESKMDITNGSTKNIHESLDSFGTLSFKRILCDSSERKCVFVEASVEDSDDPAVVIMEKIPFTEESTRGFLSKSTTLEQEMTNDIYGQYRCSPDTKFNMVKANVIHPATQKHIEKYLSKPAHLVTETPELYGAVTLPFIEEEQFSLDWVYNVLEHRKETERIIFEDPDPDIGFIIAPDFKWSGKQLEDLYCLAIVHKRNIKSLRDLNSNHLKLLKNVYSEGVKALYKKYGLVESKIRAYVHYQPSYYHLHVHFTFVEYSPPGVNAEKSHLIQTVIQNIEKDGNYYQKANLTFLLREKDKLYFKYKEAGYFDKEESATPDESLSDDETEVCVSEMDKEFEKEEDAEKTLQFLEMIGKAKHEPSGEHWETTYGESAWRMSVMCMCLPEWVDRHRLVRLTLVSSLASLGSSNDENTEWSRKIAEVKAVLRSHLPAVSAGYLGGLFEEHAAVRRGHQDGSEEHKLYRGVLELEEMILKWEEEVKDGKPVSETEELVNKMANIGFPGSDRLRLGGDSRTLQQLLAFWLKVSSLQHLRRTGWVRCGVREPETVASHMYRMGIMGLLISHNRPDVKNGDSVIISICHDIAECVIGDITPHDKVPSDVKHKAEVNAMIELVKDLPEHIYRDFFTAFQRFEDQKTDDIDARITKEFDRLDMIIQAFEYEKKEKKGKFLQQFFDSTKDYFQSVFGKKWQKVLLERREMFFVKNSA